MKERILVIFWEEGRFHDSVVIGVVGQRRGKLSEVKR